jgi:molybdopterin converting factor small subunit
MRVLIPSALHSYTGRRSEAEATGATVGALLLDLDRQYPGLRFRVVDEQDSIRTHMRVFVNGQVATLATAIVEGDEVAILMALSGG